MTNLIKSVDFHLDDADRSILRLVQKNNQITHAAIGEEIGLSTSAVRRRLVVLRASDLIMREVTILQPDAHGVTLIVHISFSEDTAEGYENFDKQMLALPNVKQSYHVSGATDYILIVQGTSLLWYEEWAKINIMTNKAVKRYDTSVVWSCKKFETEIPL